MDPALAVIRCPLRQKELFRHPLKLPFAAFGEVSALRPGCGVFIQEGRNAELLPDPLRHALGQFNALCKRHVHRGHEGDHVCRPHARMLTLVLCHIDQLGCGFGELEGRLFDPGGRADHGKHAAIVAAVCLNVQQRAAGDAVCNADELVEHDGIRFLADAEIGDTFNDFCHLLLL